MSVEQLKDSNLRDQIKADFPSRRMFCTFSSKLSKISELCGPPLACYATSNGVWKASPDSYEGECAKAFELGPDHILLSNSDLIRGDPGTQEQLLRKNIPRVVKTQLAKGISEIAQEQDSEYNVDWTTPGHWDKGLYAVSVSEV